MSKSAFACLNLALAMIIVGSSVVAGKIMIMDLPVFLASALRFLMAGLLLVPMLYVREGGLPRLSMRSYALLALQALCGAFLFTVFLLYGLKLTSPASAGIITSTTPACMGVLAWIFLKERPALRVVAGITLSVAGVLILNLNETGHDQYSHPIMGNLLVVGAVVFESMFLLLRKSIPETLSPLAASTIVALFALAFFAPMGAWEAVSFDFALVGTASWLAVAYYGVFVTVLAYLFWFTGIVRVSGSVAAVFTAVMPVSAIALSCIVLGEELGWQHVAGCAGVLAGIYFISNVGKR